MLTDQYFYFLFPKLLHKILTLKVKRIRKSNLWGQNTWQCSQTAEFSNVSYIFLH